MHYEQMRKVLLCEFPELTAPEVNWNKEVFAHFGLLFMGFGLLEHALINAVMLSSAAQEFAREKSSTGAWPDLIDKHYERATKLTFGNLSKELTKRPDFSPAKSSLDQAKGLRNYFAHHFMRVDSDLMTQDNGCLVLTFNRLC